MVSLYVKGKENGEVRTIRNETTYPIHGKYPLNPIFHADLADSAETETSAYSVSSACQNSTYFRLISIEDGIMIKMRN